MANNDLSAERFTLSKKMSSKGIREQFLGFDNKTDRPVVIETLHDSLVDDDNSLAAISSEIQVLKSLNGPYFVDYIGCYTRKNKTYNVFNFVDGEPISTATSLKTLSTRDVCSFISKSVKAIAFAHSNGIIHGALSSDSVLITPSNEPVIIGFNANWVEPITDPGIVHGVSQYVCAAPELFEGAPIDESCDFYALGKIAEFMFNSNCNKSSQKTNTESLEIIRAKEIVLSLLSRDRQHRYSAAQLLIDPDFLGSMRTPPQGNSNLTLSKKDLKKIRKNLRQGKETLRKPINDQTQILISFSIRVVGILVAGIIMLFLILKLT